jgi:hypothetical protein
MLHKEIVEDQVAVPITISRLSCMMTVRSWLTKACARVVVRKCCDVVTNERIMAADCQWPPFHRGCLAARPRRNWLAWLSSIAFITAIDLACDARCLLLLGASVSPVCWDGAPGVASMILSLLVTLIFPGWDGVAAPFGFQALRTPDGESTYDAFNYLLSFTLISDGSELRWVGPR